jgi:microbial collagenase
MSMRYGFAVLAVLLVGLAQARERSDSPNRLIEPPGKPSAMHAADLGLHAAHESAEHSRIASLAPLDASVFAVPQASLAMLQKSEPCNLSPLATLSGAAHVQAVAGSTTNCLNGLFDVKGVFATALFDEQRMIDIADAIAAGAPAYDGTNVSGVRQLILYLRAGLYVQFYYPADVAAYGAAWTLSIQTALDAFAQGSHAFDITEENGTTLTEFIGLIDASGETANQLPFLQDMLDAYGPAFHELYGMRTATNAVFFALFRAHQFSNFVAAVPVAGPGIMISLQAFIADNANDLQTTRAFLITNAAGELARFLQYTDAAFHGAADTIVKDTLDASGLATPLAPVYIRLAYGIQYYDPSHCAFFGVCDLAADVEALALPASHETNCTASLRIRTQAVEDAKRQELCSMLAAEEGVFHTLLATGNKPALGDLNTQLEVVVFHSRWDYATFSPVLFGNSVNNGGIYLEGDPGKAGNQARFLTFEADWLAPEVVVWNLAHEYVHYLDGRFDMAGDFADYPIWGPLSSVWYIEGVAEFVAYSFSDEINVGAMQAAVAVTADSLSNVLDAEYGMPESLVYHWSYLAVRFMHEVHIQKLDDLLALFRVGNYGNAGYGTWLSSVRSQFGTEFKTWVACYHKHGADTSTCNDPDMLHPLLRDGFEGDERDE